MTVSSASCRTTSRLALGLAALAVTLSACADVGSSDITIDNPTGPAVVCQSIRSAMEADKKAAEAAQAAGNTAEAKRKNEAVIAGAQGARSVENCDVNDLVPASAVPALPSGEASVAATPSPSGTP